MGGRPPVDIGPIIQDVQSIVERASITNHDAVDTLILLDERVTRLKNEVASNPALHVHIHKLVDVIRGLIVIAEQLSDRVLALEQEQNSDGLSSTDQAATAADGDSGNLFRSAGDA